MNHGYVAHLYTLADIGKFNTTTTLTLSVHKFRTLSSPLMFGNECARVAGGREERETEGMRDCDGGVRSLV